jgi:hypothetical protein
VRRWILSTPLLTLIFLSAPIACAHTLRVECVAQPPDHVLLTAWAGDLQAVSAMVRVLDPDGNEVARGTTDVNGNYAFHISEPLLYEFEVTLAGHRATVALNDEVLAALAGGTADDPAHGAEADSDAAPRVSGASETHAPHAHGAHEHDGHDEHHEHDAHHEHGGSPAAASSSSAPSSDIVTPTVAGFALIFSLAALLMIYAFKREIAALKEQVAELQGQLDGRDA